ncbi:MAG: DUF4404 family protein [Pirellulaceae bacterium]
MNEQLQETLRQLHQQIDELNDQDQLEPAEREQLAAAIAEIQESLDQHEIQSSDLAKRFHEMTESFSEAHPVLTRTAGQFADILAQMGI